MLNTSGIVSPGNSVGVLTIDGNYTQSAGGTLVLEIDAANSFDVLNVTGDANLGGTLSVLLDANFDLMAGQNFLVANIGGFSIDQFSGLTQGGIVASDNGFDLRIDYFGGDGNDLRLTTGVVVPEPASLGVVFFAIASCTMRRRRIT